MQQYGIPAPRFAHLKMKKLTCFYTQMDTFCGGYTIPEIPVIWLILSLTLFTYCFVLFSFQCPFTQHCKLICYFLLCNCVILLVVYIQVFMSDIKTPYFIYKYSGKYFVICLLFYIILNCRIKKFWSHQKGGKSQQCSILHLELENW